MSDTVSARLAAFVARTTFADLPGHVVEQARSRLLDAIGTAIAANGLAVPTAMLRFLGESRGRSTVLGCGRKAAAIDAALVNATLVNGCTHDDFLYKSHPGAVAIPAALAVGEAEGASGADLLTAVVLGYELVGRAYLGAPTMLPRFRGTGVAGAVGAAAAAGKLQRLDEAGLANALGCAAMFASGFGEGFHAGTMDVKVNVGWAARSGVSAALMARAGVSAAPTAFEGPSGFFAAFGHTRDAAGEALRGLGERFLIEDTVYKERPVCIFVQTPVQLAVGLVDELALDPRRIERVTIHASEATYTNPGFQNRAPFTTALQARISARFCTAAALLGRPVETYAYYDRTTDADVLSLAERIDLAPPVAGAEDVRLDVVYDGRTISRTGVEMETLAPTTAKVRAKFLRVAGERLGPRAESVIDAVGRLEHAADLRELMALVGSAESVEPSELEAA